MQTLTGAALTDNVIIYGGYGRNDGTKVKIGKSRGDNHDDVPNLAKLQAAGVTILDLTGAIQSSNIMDSPGLYEQDHQLVRKRLAYLRPITTT